MYRALHLFPRALFNKNHMKTSLNEIYRPDFVPIFELAIIFKAAI
jgi:hypothetical protein